MTALSQSAGRAALLVEGDSVMYQGKEDETKVRAFLGPSADPIYSIAPSLL